MTHFQIHVLDGFHSAVAAGFADQCVALFIVTPDQEVGKWCWCQQLCALLDHSVSVHSCSSRVRHTSHSIPEPCRGPCRSLSLQVLVPAPSPPTHRLYLLPSSAQVPGPADIQLCPNSAPASLTQVGVHGNAAALHAWTRLTQLCPSGCWPLPHALERVSCLQLHHLVLSQPASRPGENRAGFSLSLKLLIQTGISILLSDNLKVALKYAP